MPGARLLWRDLGQGEGVIDNDRPAGTAGRARDAGFRVLVDAVDNDATVERVRCAFCLTALGDAGEHSRKLWAAPMLSMWAGKHKGCR